MVALKKIKLFVSDTRGDAVVEATIIFPIMMFAFVGLVLVSIYLPTRASLQWSTQRAASILTTQQSDVWLKYEDGTYVARSESEIPNVYVAAFSSLFSGNEKSNALELVEENESRGNTFDLGELEVKYDVINYVIYKEIIITATRHIVFPIDLSIVNIPKEFPITVTSVATVQNGDEFIRNIDIATDFVEYLGGDELADALGKVNSFTKEFFGI